LACCNDAILLQVRHVFNCYIIVAGEHSNGIGIMVVVVVAAAAVAVVTTVTTQTTTLTTRTTVTTV